MQRLSTPSGRHSLFVDVVVGEVVFVVDVVLVVNVLVAEVVIIFVVKYCYC